MYRISSIALLVAGIALVVWGMKVSDSINSQFKEAFTGEPTDKAMWLMIGGGVLAVAGLAGLVRCTCCKK